jgi:anhydro-N-acetylmuramic acid kinase
MLSIGLMSGTSMDGIDCALLETDGSAHVVKELGNTSISYDARFKILLKAAEYAIRTCAGNMPQARSYYTQAIKDYLLEEIKIESASLENKISELSAYLHGPQGKHKHILLDEVIRHSTDLHAKAVKKLLNEKGYQAKQIGVVGYHGQTMLHQPSIKISVIVGDGQYLANLLGIKVVNDFRSRDIAAGGQGAPFAPLYHQALAIRDHKLPLLVVNCGGIANLSIIPNANEADLIAFDSGPGNGLIDRLMRQRTQGEESMDQDGRYGQQGTVDQTIIKALYAQSINRQGQNYFSLLPPKSLDIADMQLIPELAALSLEDACRNLEAFTADTIVESLDLLNIDCPHYWILAGGGWNNPVIRYELEQRLMRKFKNKIKVLHANEAGWNSQAMEAQIFAYLAVRSLQNQALSLPMTTGVPEPLSGGCLYLPEEY